MHVRAVSTRGSRCAIVRADCRLEAQYGHASGVDMIPLVRVHFPARSGLSAPAPCCSLIRGALCTAACLHHHVHVLATNADDGEWLQAHRLAWPHPRRKSTSNPLLLLLVVSR
jgi:hypothetical protein